MSCVFLLLGFLYIKIPRDRFKYGFLSPIVMLSVFVMLYTIIGFEAFWKGRYDFLGVDFSAFLNKLYDVISVFEISFFIFFIFFYYFFKNKNNDFFSYDYELRISHFYIFLLFISLYSVFSIAGIRMPVLHNFIMLFFNAAIVLVSYSYITRMKGSFFVLIIFSALIVYMGFRYRLIFLYLPIIFSLLVFYKLTLFKFLKYTLVVFLSVFLVAVVGVSRKYSEGLQLDRLEGMSFFDILIKGFFNDTSTVLTSGAIINWLDKTESFAYLKQIWYVVSYFIPNELYPNKEYSPIFHYISILTGQANNESGAAVLGFAEYYHTAGYYGVVFFAFVFSLFLCKLFKRMVFSNSKYEHFVYFVLLAWFINSLTRGYLPQNMQDLLSILIGLYLIRKFSGSLRVGGYIESTNKRL